MSKWGKVKPQTIGGQGDTKLLLPSASLWFDDFIYLCFFADKGVSDDILAHRRYMIYCKETMENQEHTQNFKTFKVQDIEGKPFKNRLCIL